MKRKEKFYKGELVKNVLIVLGIAAGFGAVIVMPGLAVGLKAIVEALEERGYHPSKKQLRESLRRLDKKKIISLKKVDGDLLVTFREKGKNLLLRYRVDELEIKRPRRWDRKWRIVAFDVPEEKKLARNILREKLKELKFHQLQRSIFVHPYGCEREIELIKKVYEVEPYVRFVVAESIDNQAELTKKFKL